MVSYPSNCIPDRDVNSPVVISKPVLETDDLKIPIHTILNNRMIVTGSKANLDRQDCSRRGRSSSSLVNTFIDAQFSMGFLDFRNWTLLNHRPSSYFCNALEK